MAKKLYTEINYGAVPGISWTQLSNAVSCWAWMNQLPLKSVADAAATFNTTPEIIRQAAEEHAWMLLLPANEPDPSKQFIEHDGE